jgi:hypothetical protein
MHRYGNEGKALISVLAAETERGLSDALEEYCFTVFRVYRLSFTVQHYILIVN